ncbi:hypothetical protein F2P56_007075 [Juglans regia]|uniref:Bromo domain-containing protein n=2 Tax=Juglans regia TaxID=51240 RepID=A0A833Y0X0_JUGRE|nr:transcription factor GTE12-like isoform X1 [Juglans regia]KAF5475246.1 hypothetical protein F2P56_007075 [Juglans regia]
MIATETMVANKKLNIKFSMKRIEANLDNQACGLEQLESLVDEWNRSSSVNGSNGSERKKMHSICRSDGTKKLEPEYPKEKFSRPGSKKRGPPELIECPKEKRQRMDRSVTSHCSTILKKLMSHPAGWVFNKPVDPVALNIPDYFTIISNPMDLGTIKFKLEKNMYFDTEGFAADIRLTFSNAMLYNPPGNSVHKMAQELNNVFETRWKSFGEKWDYESSKVGQRKLSTGKVTETIDTRQGVQKAPLRNNLLIKRSLPTIEKVKSSDGRDVEVMKIARDCTQKSSGNDSHKGIDNSSRHARASVNNEPLEPPSILIACRCGQCGAITCLCSLPCNATNASSSDLSSERSLDRDHRICGFDASRQAISGSSSHISKSDPDSDGAVSALDYENACLSSRPTPPATDPASEGGCSVFDEELSPKKALRVAMLKSRFAETILKAQHGKLLDHGDKADPLNLQQEKERLKRRQSEERARIEAQMRVAKAASQIKEEAEQKQQREREREAARAALHKMERAVHLEENLWIQKELDMLLGCSLSCSRTLLEKLGLFIKDESMEDDEVNLNVDGEEGEIFS